MRLLTVLIQLVSFGLHPVPYATHVTLAHPLVTGQVPSYMVVVKPSHRLLLHTGIGTRSQT